MSDTSILNILMQAILDQLINEIQVDVSDETKAGLVRIGKLQSDPTIYEFNLMIKNGGREWKHVRATDSHHALRQVGSFAEIGGTRAEFWLRRFTIELKLFFVGETDQEQATEHANVILSRTEQALLNMSLSTGVSEDSFGESPVWLDIEDSYLNESGGPGEYIHRGELRIEILTERQID